MAGIAVFQASKFWSYHVGFVHYFSLNPLIMLILSFFGGIPKSLISVCLLVL
ncbi:DUF6220 domain-containing protein [Metabacillus sp. RGM 3146]|uniref:DUF6220 domain-containing protein n=1 Tax=Metabacillus sp. RGM 3146 TaxID=3401092 RepID=UPI003B9BD111